MNKKSVDYVQENFPYLEQQVRELTGLVRQLVEDVQNLKIQIATAGRTDCVGKEY